jgi:hypothetical protein
MSEDDKVSFGSQCPKGHMPTLVFHREELQKSLKEGTLQLFLQHVRCSLDTRSAGKGKYQEVA